MLGINDLKPGVIFLYNNQPYKVLESSHLKKAQSKGMMQIRMQNLIYGNVIETTFKSSENFQEADITIEERKFLYKHRENFCFVDPQDPKNRFYLKEEQIKEYVPYLKPETEVKVIFFEEKPISIEIPIKMEFKVIEAPPGLKGDTAQSGTKTVIIETGAKIQTPLFIQEGDVIRVNTRTGEYLERIKKEN